MCKVDSCINKLCLKQSSIYIHPYIQYILQQCTSDKHGNVPVSCECDNSVRGDLELKNHLLVASWQMTYYDEVMMTF